MTPPYICEKCGHRILDHALERDSTPSAPRHYRWAVCKIDGCECDLRPNFDPTKGRSIEVANPAGLSIALRAMEQWRAENPEHAAWIAEGYPALTEQEHLYRFGYVHPGKKHRA